ncbi:MAG: hypothetical protein ACXAB5_01360 [Candidatus Thorarchaeota archaeon]
MKSIRDRVLGDLSELDISTETRDTSVMTRLSGSFVEIIDALVKLGIFKSRSEAIASIIEGAILKKFDMFQQLKLQADKLDEIQDSAKSLAFKALTEEK